MNLKTTARLLATLLMVLLATSPRADAARVLLLEQAKARCHYRLAPDAGVCVTKVDAADGPASGQEAKQTDFPPPSGTGRIVIVISGSDGPDAYRNYAENVTMLGYYTILIDGREILTRDQKGGERLRKVIANAQTAQGAIAGKVAVIGFSMGGGGALAYAERQPDVVAVVVAYYPATSFIAEGSGMKTFVERFEVPAVVFAGAQDFFYDCCLLTTAKAMEASAKELNKPMELIIYPNAGHNFIKGAGYRPDDAKAAWQRTTNALHQYLGDPPER